MGRATYIRNRLILMVFVLFGVTIVIFSMVHFLPGDPAAILLGDRATVQNVADLHEQLGLNRSMPEQYWLFVSGLVRGQMGTSLMFRQPVSDLVLSRVPISLSLAVYAMGLSAVFTLIFGLAAAVNQGRWHDQAIRVVFLVILTTPNFWFGILLILLLSLWLHWFPVAGFGETFQEHVWYLFLPALTLALQLSAVLIRNLRSQVIHTLRSDFVRTARAKGLPEHRIVTRHALRAALLPLVSYLGPACAGLLTGSLVVERIFNLPGLGKFFVISALQRDYTVVMGMVIVYAGLILALNLVADLLYAVLDPRVRLA
jgi:ABC-type dipeptide/oligopeptide/nickel transport system permease component